VLSADFVLSYSPHRLGFEDYNYNLPLNESNIDNESITPHKLLIFKLKTTETKQLLSNGNKIQENQY
jgi:hypothetical protein